MSIERHNGLSEAAPNPDQTIIVAGGAGYIGCVLIPRLLERGYRVRLLERLYFGEEPLAYGHVADAEETGGLRNSVVCHEESIPQMRLIVSGGTAGSEETGPRPD